MSHLLTSRIKIAAPATYLFVALSLIAFLTALSTGSLALFVVSFYTLLLAVIAELVTQPPSNRSDSQSSDKMISMVAFFEELPYVDETILSAHVKRAWGLEIENNENDESFVAGSAPLFVVKTDHQMYAINYIDKNYFDNVDEVLEEVTELRLANVIRSHQAWISVDLVSDSQQLGPAFHYEMIGRLLNQLASHDCVGLLLPDRMKLLPWDETIEAALDSGIPLETLSPSQPPVIPIDDNDPQLVAAVSMAQNRFPQFVTAFENHRRDEDRDESRQFAVKAPFKVGNRTEFIWMAVTAIENGILYGTLDNQPVSLPGLRRGDTVRIAISKLNDWIYTQDDRSFGGFTSKVIANWARSH